MSGFRGIPRLQLGKLTITPSLARKKAQGSVIILHGSCDTGSGMKAWLDKIRESEFNFHDYRILYPSAPTRPYTLLNGEACVWFDRLSLGPSVPEDLMAIESTANELNELLRKESKNTGIPLTRMILGGFSMGGIMALHMGYRFQTEMAGVFALSSFLPIDSIVFDTLQERTQPSIKKSDKMFHMQEKIKKYNEKTKTSTPTLDKILQHIKLEEGVKPPQFPRLFMSQGSRDPLVRYPWARRTFTILRRYGVQGHFFTHPSGDHNIERKQLILLHRWIQEVLTGNSGSSPSTRKKDKRKKRRNINDQACEPIDSY